LINNLIIFDANKQLQLAEDVKALISNIVRKII